MSPRLFDTICENFATLMHKRGKSSPQRVALSLRWRFGLPYAVITRRETRSDKNAVGKKKREGCISSEAAQSEMRPDGFPLFPSSFVKNANTATRRWEALQQRCKNADIALSRYSYFERALQSVRSELFILCLLFFFFFLHGGDRSGCLWACSLAVCLNDPHTQTAHTSYRSASSPKLFH